MRVMLVFAIDRGSLPMDMPCICEEEEFKHKHTWTEQRETAVNLQSLSRACRMKIPKHIQQGQKSGALSDTGQGHRRVSCSLLAPFGLFAFMHFCRTM